MAAAAITVVDNVATIESRCILCDVVMSEATRYRIGRKECRQCRNQKRRDDFKRTGPTNREKTRLASRMTYARLRQKILDAYGCRCAHCGIENAIVLDLDHVNDNGSEHRASLYPKGRGNQSGTYVYNYVVRNGFPHDFQLLCKNCNWVKHMKSKGWGPYGICGNNCSR